jgi:hypothetical protein
MALRRPTYPVYQPERRPWKPPQREHEVFSLARRFDGVDDNIRLNIGACNLIGAYTIAALCRTNIDHIPDNLVVNHSPPNTVRCLLTQTEDAGAGEDYLVGLPSLSSGGALTSPPISETAMRYRYSNDWSIQVATKTAGSVIPRFHIYVNGTWRHADGQIAVNDPVSQGGGNIRIPSFGGLSFDPYDFAVAAEWNGQALTDGQVEELSVNRRTLDWLNNSGGEPAGLWQFNQSTTATLVTDLTGNGADQTLIVGSEVITTGPTGWTYEENPVVEFGVPTLVQRRLASA